MIKNTSNIEKCQPVSLCHDQFALENVDVTTYILHPLQCNWKWDQKGKGTDETPQSIIGT